MVARVTIGASRTGSRSVLGVRLRASRRGPPRAVFDGFYREHFVTAWRALHRLGVDAADCDDAAQETFVAAHRHWHACDDDVPRRAWLLAIARKIAWRYRRTDERRMRRIDALARIEPVVPSLDELMLRREAARLLAEFLERLDQGKREAFVLGELEELGRRELGIALGINANTAYGRLQAARREFFTHFAALDDHGCATLLACADTAETPDQTRRNRAWATLAIVLWPRPAMLPIAFGLAALMGIATVVATDDAPHGASTEARALVEPTHTSDVAEPRPVPVTPPAALAVPTAESCDVSPTTRARPRHSIQPVLTLSPAPAPKPDELALLLAARAAMVAGDLASARRKLDDHAAQFGLASPLATLRSAIVRDLDATPIRSAPTGDPISTRSTR